MSKVISIRVSEITQITLEMKAKSEGKNVGDIVKQAINDSLDTHKIDKIKAEQKDQEVELEKLFKKSHISTLSIISKLSKADQALNSWEERITGSSPSFSVLAILILTSFSTLFSLLILIMKFLE
ncbi:hypothetical protein [Vibrio kanaloae]|uniref:hypothetical protein n=1 Tax=Vibrio kanaloae TaxID=170673 RepID=UPI0010BD7011|nr:hypothetical protein [Vibrio kanaloae]TKE97958.1 hypothetical protein FCV46_20720 [Vibrio kanaloae]TKF56634.1 hypothetical protein FCV51_17975 [Vibrio kanaloae]